MVFDDNVLEPASPLLSALPEHTRGRSDDALEGEYIAIADRRPRRNIRRPDRTRSQTRAKTEDNKQEDEQYTLSMASSPEPAVSSGVTASSSTMFASLPDSYTRNHTAETSNAEIPRSNNDAMVMMMQTQAEFFKQLIHEVRSEKIDRDSVDSFEALLKKANSYEDAMKLRTSRQYRPVVIQSGNIRVPPPSQSSPASSLVRPAEGPSHRSPLAPSASAPITNSGTPLLHEEQNVSQTESKRTYCTYCRRSTNHVKTSCPRLLKKNNNNSDLPNLPPSQIACYGCGSVGVIRANCSKCQNLNVYAMDYKVSGKIDKVGIQGECSSVTNNFKRPILDIEVLGFQTTALVDSAAKSCIAGYSLYQFLLKQGHPFQEVKRLVKFADGELKNMTVLSTQVDFTSVQVLVERLKLKCKKCRCTFVCYNEYQRHIASHITEQSRHDANRFRMKHKCKQCRRKFVQLSTLKAHAIVHKPFPHMCHCGVGFRARADLQSHEALVHTPHIEKELSHSNIEQNSMSFTKNNNKHNLTKCIDGFFQNPPTNYRTKMNVMRINQTNMAEILKNVDIKRGTAERPFICDLCGKGYTQKITLKLHIKRHAGILDYTCNYCGKKVFELGALRRHERTHTGAKPYECSFCHKGFSDPSALMRHERTHTNVKPYKCKLCGMLFSDASGRIEHEKRHWRQKKYECDKCPRQFYTKHDLVSHAQCVHSDVRRFKCDHCHKSFKRKSYLYIHMRIYHTKGRQYECDDCGKKTVSKGYLVPTSHANQ
ncbi:hypothetical protein ACJJTC_015313, partial [Scirpophaga incertulas]